MRIKRDHLTLLFNQLYDRGDERFTIEHPCDEVGELVTVDLADPAASTVTFDKDLKAYANARNAAELAHGERISNDLPDHNVYRNAVVASGIVDIENLEQVTTLLDRYGDPDLMAGHKPVFAGFDTNLLPWRIDRILGLRDPDQGVGFVNGFVLAEGVRDELDWDVKCHNVDPYVNAYGKAAEEFWNQPVGTGRISRLGLSAYRELRDIQQAAEIESNPGDEAILAAYDDWEDEVRGQVMLFSNDRNFVEGARSRTLLAEVVKLPSVLPDTTTASWRELEVLVYLLTVVFGVMELPGVTLHGVWRGKEGIDWQQERVKLAPRSPVLEDGLVGDLSVVETFEELNEGL